jgi:hypothetical protein
MIDDPREGYRLLTAVLKRRLAVFQMHAFLWEPSEAAHKLDGVAIDPLLGSIFLKAMLSDAVPMYSTVQNTRPYAVLRQRCARS